MPTASVVHSYKALIWSNLRPEDYTPETRAVILTSLAYVQCWHGFGLGKVEAFRGGEGDAEQRLVRFMQAYGIDTSHVRPGSLKQYLKGRQVFLRIGRQTVRAPVLYESHRVNEKTPPADVPEYELLCILQKHRRSWVRYLERRVVSCFLFFGEQSGATLIY